MLSQPHVLILAGQRLGKVDPLASAHGQTYKCLVPLLGRPLIAYVLDAVDAAFPACRISISINDPAALDDVPELQRLFAAGRLRVEPSANGLLESVLAAAEQVRCPLLITTGDNVLMTAEALAGFRDFAVARHADGAAMFARKEDILAAHDEGQPRFWRFRDGEFSGCNTFWISNREALGIAEIFRGGGQFLKFPGRFIAAFGLANLLGFRLHLFSVERMLARLSRRFGKQLAVQIASDGALAIDVDNAQSHAAAQTILGRRAAAAVSV